MNFKTYIISASLLPLLAASVHAQTYGNQNGQQFDAYGRPLASVESLCREGQMAGGPITAKCAAGNFYFNRKGEKLVRYDFMKWGYDMLTQVTEETAKKLDADPKYRAAYIKTNDIKPYVKKEPSDDDVIGVIRGVEMTRAKLREHCANIPDKHAPECR